MHSPRHRTPATRTFRTLSRLARCDDHRLGPTPRLRRTVVAAATLTVLAATGWGPAAAYPVGHDRPRISILPGELSSRSTPSNMVAASRLTGSPVPGELSATDAVTADDVWAVGAYPAGGGYAPLVEHWNGRSWKRIPAPVPGDTSTSYLLTVTAVSSNDVWAAGSKVLADGVTMRTLIEHWNGRRWQIVDSPSVNGDWNMLNGIDAVAADDVWVVGDGGNGAAISTLVEHWNGRRWQIVDSANVAGRVNQLNHVTVISPHDIWAVGYDAILDVQYSTLAEHWNGHAWSIVRTPNLHDPNFDLQDVSSVASGDVWAVGSYYSNELQQFRTLAEHWNGTRWKVVASPNPRSGAVASFPLAVTSVSSSDVWSSGWYEVAGGDEVAFMEHWNGRAWRLVTIPDIPNTPYSNLIGLTGLTGTDAWAVGSLWYGGSWASLYEHWNGTSWKVIEQRH